VLSEYAQTALKGVSKPDTYFYIGYLSIMEVGAVARQNTTEV